MYDELSSSLIVTAWAVGDLRHILKRLYVYDQTGTCVSMRVCAAQFADSRRALELLTPRRDKVQEARILAGRGKSGEFF